jgi:GDP-L-fucose synthase
MDSSKFRALGWQPKIDLHSGIQQTYAWFLEHQGSYKALEK